MFQFKAFLIYWFSSLLDIISIFQQTVNKKFNSEYKTWTSAEKSPATYEVYGGTSAPGTWQCETEPPICSIHPNALDNRDDLWVSAKVKGDRGVKVTFEKPVTINRFQGPYF